MGRLFGVGVHVGLVLNLNSNITHSVFNTQINYTSAGDS